MTNRLRLIGVVSVEPEQVLDLVALVVRLAQEVRHEHGRGTVLTGLVQGGEKARRIRYVYGNCPRMYVVTALV